MYKKYTARIDRLNNTLLFYFRKQSSRPLQARVAAATFTAVQTLRHVTKKTQQMRGYRTATLNLSLIHI